MDVFSRLAHLGRDRQQFEFQCGRIVSQFEIDSTVNHLVRRRFFFLFIRRPCLPSVRFVWRSFVNHYNYRVNIHFVNRVSNESPMIDGAAVSSLSVLFSLPFCSTSTRRSRLSRLLSSSVRRCWFVRSESNHRQSLGKSSARRTETDAESEMRPVQIRRYDHGTLVSFRLRLRFESKIRRRSASIAVKRSAENVDDNITKSFENTSR